MSRALRPALALSVCATLTLSACSALPGDASGTEASDASDSSNTQSTSPSTQPAAASDGPYAAGYLHIGDCLAQAPQDSTALESVDCTQEHAAEVIHVFDLTGTARPSDDDIDNTSDEACAQAFRAYVGRPFENSALDVTWRVPSDETWADGDRRVECIAFTRDESQLTTTMKDTNM